MGVIGILWSALRYAGPIYRQSYPPKPEFSTSQIPDLTGRVIIVTGGNAGIGKETIRVLLEHNAKVYMASRDRKKAEAAIEELKKTTGREALFLELNLANLASVRKAAETFLTQEKELHVLFNNAGIYDAPTDWLTDDGYDMTFGVNVVGHFLLTQLLMPALEAGKDTSPDHYSRIIWLSSFGSYLSTLHWDTLKDTPQRKKVRPEALYAQSKFAALLLARECAKRFGDQGILSLSVNPGNIQTEIFRHVPKVDLTLTTLVFRQHPIEYGALTQLWAGTMPEALKHNGEYVVPWARIADRARAEAYDDELCAQLWKWLEKEVEGK
ncbi:NAD-binding protein [Fomitopsis schrenkii]|uniref:NAD-binding protein n=1 Tax=Fomitopsis schrenkii TaxID=2126942 RepID=S8FV37_FOMSC|nr:NAD-binding protein [Fomitopsis schrenkii]